MKEYFSYCKLPKEQTAEKQCKYQPDNYIQTIKSYICPTMSTALLHLKQQWQGLLYLLLQQCC